MFSFHLLVIQFMVFVCFFLFPANAAQNELRRICIWLGNLNKENVEKRRNEFKREFFFLCVAVAVVVEDGFVVYLFV